MSSSPDNKTDGAPIEDLERYRLGVTQLRNRCVKGEMCSEEGLVLISQRESLVQQCEWLGEKLEAKVGIFQLLCFPSSCDDSLFSQGG